MKIFSKVGIALSALILPTITLGAGVVVSEKNEMTEKVTYTYFQTSQNYDNEFLRMWCHPNGKVEVQLCANSCHLSFNYKFDNQEVQTKLYDTKRDTYKWSLEFAKQLKKHSKLVIQDVTVINGKARTLDSTPTPVFDLTGITKQFRKFEHQCTIGGVNTSVKHSDTKGGNSETKVNSKVSNLNHSKVHYHGNKKHSHPLPREGVTHRHNGIPHIGSTATKVTQDLVGQQETYIPSTSSRCHYVSGYYRKSGTYVRGYTRCR